MSDEKTARGLARAREQVQAEGHDWATVEILRDAEAVRRARARFGLPNAVSEHEDPAYVFGAHGALFIDEETGRPVAYAPSAASRQRLAIDGPSP